VVGSQFLTIHMSNNFIPAAAQVTRVTTLMY